MIRSFNPFRPTSTTISQSRTCLRVLTALSMQSVFTSRMDERLFIRCTWFGSTGSSASAPDPESNGSFTFRISADTASQSQYIRKRGEGELAVQAAFAGARLVRPAVMFGPDVRVSHPHPQAPPPASNLSQFGHGLTRLQPVYVEDVAEAIGRIMQHAETPSMIFELGGPRVYSYKELLGAIARQAGLAPLLIPIPFAVWHALAWASEMFPGPLLTRNQVELMQIDTVSSPEMPGFIELGISPHSVDAILQKILSSCE